ncbi:MAG: hypothetical protein GY719_11375 [bacterium]|nr:hypothetical protein [bacterium]
MRRIWIVIALLTVASAARSTPEDAPAVLIDRLVAVVDEDPIFLSDIRRAVGLGLVETVPGESDQMLERRVLDALIDERLRLHEVERHDFGTLPPEEIDRQVELIRANFADEGELRQSLDRLGLDDDGLRLLVARQLRVLVYVQKRLGPRVFISPEDIGTYYDDVLVPEMTRRGLEAPALEAVRAQIRDVLQEERLNEQIDVWTRELRLEADIADYLQRAETELPPVVERIEE